MKLGTLAWLCSVLSLIGFASGKGARPAKRYKVNLDDPPATRWRPVLQDFDKAQIQAVVDVLVKDYLKSNILFDLLEDVGKNIEKYLPQPYADEMSGIAEYYHVSVGEIVIANLAYDVSAWDTDRFKSLFGCTSIVASDHEGNIIHGRNLDYGASENLRDITIEVEFHHSGETVFIATTYVGYVGILTALKPKAFTLSGDERNKGRLIENILAALEKHWPTMLMSREVMMHANNFETAVNMIAKAETISPMYFIIGGVKPHEGAVIVRDRWGAVNISRMSDTSHKWFVLETNYDPWEQPPSDDDRRETGVYAMEVFGQERMSLANLYGVLTIPPVFNSDTTYTATMSAADPSTYRTMIRYDHPIDV